MKKKLLFFVNDAPFLISHRWPVMKAAKEVGYDVHALTPPDAASEAFFAREGVTFHALPMCRRSTNPFKEFVTLCRVVQQFKNIQPDIVHLVTIKPVIYGGLAARIARVPAKVSAISGMGYLFIREGVVARVVQWLVRQLYRAALAHKNGKVIFQNPDDRKFFTESGIVDIAHTVLIRGSGVDLSQYMPAPEPEGRTRVTMVSRFLSDKGIREFAEAARMLKERGTPVIFTVVGYIDPSNPASLAQPEVEGWVKEGIVENWGRRDDIAEVYKQSHIACLPSYREGLPKSLLEAAASGRVIVTTDVPGCREVVEHGRNGLLVPVRNAKALAEAVAGLVQDREDRLRMGREGRARAEAEFGITSVVAATLAIYQGLSL
jgi:glycosyltransferase involved in cell wall biosynthesis